VVVVIATVGQRSPKKEIHKVRRTWKHQIFVGRLLIEISWELIFVYLIIYVGVNKSTGRGRGRGRGRGTTMKLWIYCSSTDLSINYVIEITWNRFILSQPVHNDAIQHWIYCYCTDLFKLFVKGRHTLVVYLNDFVEVRTLVRCPHYSQRKS